MLAAPPSLRGAPAVRGAASAPRRAPSAPRALRRTPTSAHAAAASHDKPPSRDAAARAVAAPPRETSSPPPPRVAVAPPDEPTTFVDRAGRRVVASECGVGEREEGESVWWHGKRALNDTPGAPKTNTRARWSARAACRGGVDA